MGEIYLRVLFSRAGLPAASFNMLSIRVGAAREHAAAAEPEHADCILGRKTKERLYAARLRFDDSYTGISCSSPHSPSTVVLGFLRFDPGRGRRPRTSPLQCGHPAARRRSGTQCRDPSTLITRKMSRRPIPESDTMRFSVENWYRNISVRYLGFRLHPLTTYGK